MEAHHIILKKEEEKAFGILYPNGSVLLYTDYSGNPIPRKWFVDIGDAMDYLEADSFESYIKESASGKMTSRLCFWQDWLYLAIRESIREYGDSEAIQKALVLCESLKKD